MKNKVLFTFLVSLLCTNSIFAISYTSATSGTWTTTTTWSPAGVPGLADVVTILSTHTVTVDSYSQVMDATINSGGTLTINTGISFAVYGLLTNNGNIAGAGRIGLRRSDGGTVLDGTGTWTHSGDLWFNNSASTTQIIASTFNMTKSAGGNLRLNNTSSSNSNEWVTNNGTIVLTGNNTVVPFTTNTSRWTQGAGASLTVTAALLNNSAAILDATAAGNTIRYGSTSAFSIKQPLSDQYQNLIIAAGASSGTKSLGFNVIVNNLTVNAGASVGFDVNGFNIDVSGNWTKNGGILDNTGTVTFTGSGAQSIGGTSNTIFANLSKTGSGTLTLARNLQVNNNMTLTGGTFDVSASNFSVTIAQNFTNDATFNAQSGTVTMNGSSAQTMSGTSTTTFNNLTISNASGVTASSPLIINGTVVISAGTFTTGATSITLSSTAARTARIGNSAGSILGTNWIVQRYIPSSTANWDDISSPISGSTMQDWDCEIYLSLNDACTPGMGFPCGDGTANGWNSVYTFNTATQVFDAITTCDPAITTARGYELWLGTTLSTLSTTTLTTVGNPNMGTIAASLASSSGQWSLIGNPHASGISWALVFADATNISNFFQIYDETIDNYAIYDGATPALSTGQLLGSGGIIASTQGFWVQNSAASPSLSFQQADKSAVNRPLVKEAAPVLPNDVLKMRLYTNTMKNASECVIKIQDDATEKFDAATDVSFLKSRNKLSPELTPVTADGIKTRMKAIPAKNTFSIPLVAAVGVPGTYFIDFKGANTILKYNSVQLEDVETGIITPLSFDQAYSFTQNDITKERRFILHFSNVYTNETPFANSVRIYSVPEGIALNFNFEEATNAHVSVYNLLGENIANQNNKVEKEIIILPLSAASQVYLIKVTTPSETSTHKVFH